MLVRRGTPHHCRRAAGCALLLVPRLPANRQRLASGMATVNVLLDQDAVVTSGEMTRITRVADSGNTVERAFCMVCGSQMYSRTVEGPKLPIRIRAGTLDDPDICPPTTIIWGKSAPSWAPFPPCMTVFEGGPGSAEMLDRV